MSELDLSPFKVEFDRENFSLWPGDIIELFYPTTAVSILAIIHDDFRNDYDDNEDSLYNCICLHGGKTVKFKIGNVKAIYRINKLKY